MMNASEISSRILEAVLAGKLSAGSRLGEQQLGELFNCSRTIVREALTRLAERGIVIVSARRGWFVLDPSADEAREAFEARLVVETGLIRSMKPLDKPALKKLNTHIKRQQAAVKANDVGLRSFLLGDFHVCLAECLGNSLLAETIRDFTARTTLAAMRFQSGGEAAQSCAEHAQIVEALESGDLARAEQLMAGHLSTWRVKLPVPADTNPLSRLRQALQPVEPAPKSPGKKVLSGSRKKRADRSDTLGEPL